MRELTTHHTNECNKAITVDVCEDESGEPHGYTARWRDSDDMSMEIDLWFQHGPIAEVGTNGLTNELLLAIVADRLAHFQRGKFACVENQMALDHVTEALRTLEDRTKRRTAQGVEGTHQPDPEE